MSLINREDLIAEYDRVHVGAPGGARKLIVDAPEVAPEPKWIPVSERLPEKYGWYMCTLKDYRVNTYYWNNKGEWIDNGKKHFFELYNISSRYTGEDIIAEQEGSVYWTDWVIAWMPLPNPYKKGSVEK